jgi:SAM-dependent methyltransferase
MSISNYLKPIKECLFNPYKLIPLFSWYYSDYRKLKAMRPEQMGFKLVANNPQLLDRVSNYGALGNLVYEDSWAFKQVVEFKPEELIDIGSSRFFIAMSSMMGKVTSLDIRELECCLPNLKFKIGDIMNLPYADKTVRALSSLSVIEHIGLGRYGDKLDIRGMEIAAKELSRVLAPGGMLLVAFPTGVENAIQFNAHRICTPETARNLFPDLELVEERYALRDKIIDRATYEQLGRPYGYGCYRYTRKA